MKGIAIHFFLITLFIAISFSSCSDSRYLKSNYASALKHRGSNSIKQTVNDRFVSQDIQSTNSWNQEKYQEILSFSDSANKVLFPEKLLILKSSESDISEENQYESVLPKKITPNNFIKDSVPATHESPSVFKAEDDPKPIEKQKQSKKPLNKYVKISLWLAFIFVVLMFAFFALYSAAFEFLLYIILFTMAGISFTTFVLSIVAIIQTIKNSQTERGIGKAILLFLLSSLTLFIFAIYILSAF